MNALQTHRFLMRIALAAVNLFAWIFVFQYFFARSSTLGGALLETILVYMIAQVVILFLTPISARRLRNGIIRPMVQGVVLVASAYGILALSFSGYLGMHIVWGVVLFSVLRGMYHALYWIPYSLDSVRGVERSPMTRLLQEGALVLVPAIAGLILMSGMTGFNALFYTASALTLLSIVPLSYIKESHEGYSWGYVESFEKVLGARYRNLTMVAFLDGISGAALLLFWPIAVFLLVGWSYAVFGVVMSVTYLLVYLTRSYVRATLKKMEVGSSPLIHAFLAVSGWVLRLIVATPLGVVLVDSYFYTGTQVHGTGVNTFVFEQFADHGAYIDEYTALKEMALASGKIAICALGALFAALISLPVTLIGVFLIAAAASGMSAFFSRRNALL